MREGKNDIQMLLEWLSPLLPRVAYSAMLHYWCCWLNCIFRCGCSTHRTGEVKIVQLPTFCSISQWHSLSLQLIYNLSWLRFLLSTQRPVLMSTSVNRFQSGVWVWEHRCFTRLEFLQPTLRWNWQSNEFVQHKINTHSNFLRGKSQATWIIDSCDEAWMIIFSEFRLDWVAILKALGI